MAYDIYFNGECWSATNILAFIQDIEILVKSLGYQLKVEREGDMVIVYAV
nr:MAG TPA: hypothetical protein [Caudoviricetes sp.]